MIHSANPHSPGRQGRSVLFSSISKSGDGRTDNICEYIDHYRLELWSASWIKMKKWQQRRKKEFPLEKQKKAKNQNFSRLVGNYIQINFDVILFALPWKNDIQHEAHLGGFGLL